MDEMNRIAAALERIADAQERELEEDDSQAQALREFLQGVQADNAARWDAYDKRQVENHAEIMRQQKEWMDQQAVVRNLERPATRQQ